MTPKYGDVMVSEETEMIYLNEDGWVIFGFPNFDDMYKEDIQNLARQGLSYISIAQLYEAMRGL
jgi:sulfite reductase alpha subunit-like flavoprotein